MDWLKNLASNVYSGVNKVGSYLGSVINQGNANVAGLFNSTYVGGTPKPSAAQQAVNTAQNNAYIANNGQPQYTPVPEGIKASAMLANPNKGTITSQGNFNAAQIANSASPAYTPVAGSSPSYTNSSGGTTPYEIGNYRSALPAVTGGQDTRVSNANQGIPYVDENGKLVIPKAGFSGQIGAGQSLSSYTAGQGMPGLDGGGSSAYTGLLSGTSGLGTPSAISSEVDPTTGKKKTTITMPKNMMTPAPSLPGTGNAQQIAANAQGQMTPFVQPSEQMNVKVPPNYDLGGLETMKSSASDAMIDIGTNDFESFKQNFSKAYESALTEINAKNPTPEQPIQFTPEQEALISQSQDPFGAAQALSNFMTSQTDLTRLNTEMIDVKKQILAENQTFSSIVSDTKTNPDLPKGLAMRRINEIQSTQKTRIDQLLGMADILNDQISAQQEVVNRNFQIQRDAQNNNEKAQERELAKFKLFLDSGAIGAFTDADIKKYSAVTGLSTSAIQKMKDSAKNPDLDIYTTTDDSGTVRGIDKNIGGTKTVAQPDIKEFQGQYATFANRLEQAIPILFDTLAPTITNMSAAQLQAYVTANDIAPIIANRATPDNVKSYIQASRDLINAVLRKESGAVISPSEFATARGQYLPMPGDNAQALAQKRTSAMANLNNFKNAAGGAYVPSVAVPVASSPSTGTGTQFKGSSGKTYNLPY